MNLSTQKNTIAAQMAEFKKVNWNRREHILLERILRRASPPATHVVQGLHKASNKEGKQ